MEYRTQYLNKKDVVGFGRRLKKKFEDSSQTVFFKMVVSVSLTINFIETIYDVSSRNLHDAEKSMLSIIWEKLGDENEIPPKENFVQAFDRYIVNTFNPTNNLIYIQKSQIFLTDCGIELVFRDLTDESFNVPGISWRPDGTILSVMCLPKFILDDMGLELST